MARGKLPTCGPICRRFLAARRRAGLTQVDLARKTGIAQSTIQLMETTSAHAELQRARRIARALGVTVEKLIGP